MHAPHAVFHYLTTQKHTHWVTVEEMDTDSNTYCVQAKGYAVEDMSFCQTMTFDRSFDRSRSMARHRGSRSAMCEPSRRTWLDIIHDFATVASTTRVISLTKSPSLQVAEPCCALTAVVPKPDVAPSNGTSSGRERLALRSRSVMLKSEHAGARSDDFAQLANELDLSAKARPSRREEPKSGQLVLAFRLIT